MKEREESDAGEKNLGKKKKGMKDRVDGDNGKKCGGYLFGVRLVGSGKDFATELYKRCIAM